MTDDKVFTVDEWLSGFELVHNPSGKRHWLSDGVDALFDENDHAISPGTPGFRETWEREFNEDVEETMAAYFPELVED